MPINPTESNPLDPAFKALIENPANWHKFQELFNASTRIVGDFDMYGEVLQTGEDDDDGTYGDSSNIEQLRTSVRDIDPAAIEARQD